MEILKIDPFLIFPFITSNFSYPSINHGAAGVTISSCLRGKLAKNRPNRENWKEKGRPLPSSRTSGHRLRKKNMYRGRLLYNHTSHHRF